MPTDSGAAGEGLTWEKGWKRKKLSGYLKAANELRQSYTAAYSARSFEDEALGENDGGMQQAFPDMKVARSGEEEMVLFPSYARRHVKRNETPRTHLHPETPDSESGPGNAEYWRREWVQYEDANAIVDIDVRGWIYSPHKGPMTRKNRILFGIARHLSGIPAPGSRSGSITPADPHSERASQREEEKIEREAEAISRRGRQEADIAGRGGYSEQPGHGPGPENSSIHRPDSASRTPSPKPGDFPHKPLTNASLDLEQDGPPGSGSLAKRASSLQPSDMSAAELALANKNLLARLRPFLHNPAINLSLTIFYYNDDTSQSRTTRTNEAGHFNFRAALNFVPTHVRVLASSNLSATEEAHITESKGISLISDIDDTIKHSSIGSGAREIFRNTFVRELGDLTIEGVKEWYTAMSNLGVKLHYVSNSPWQLYPVLVTFFAIAGLPPGSFHLKQYSGMLQGIFEPVAERKKATLDRIMSDFPERRFILVGDSGEADLELYTDVVLANPERILGVFIRDVTTPPSQGFFEPSLSPWGGRDGRLAYRGRSENDSWDQRPQLPPRPASETPAIREPIVEDLIDFSDEPAIGSPTRSLTDTPSARDPKQTPSSKDHPPSRPFKPLTLRSISTENTASSHTLYNASGRKGPPPPPKPQQYSRNSGITPGEGLSPLQPHSSHTSKNSVPDECYSYRAAAKTKVANAYNSIPSVSTYWNSQAENRGSAEAPPQGMDAPGTPPPIPPRRNLTSYPAAAAHYATARLRKGEGEAEEPGGIPASGMSKREEMWKRRWARAKDILDEHGVMLRGWRVGQDVATDAIALVKKAEYSSEGKGKGRK
jgi:phosphatidate phosphatase APP1